MTRADLKKVPGFIDWVTEPKTMAFLHMLADALDEEIGGGGYANHLPHMAHINLGVMEASRRYRDAIKAPLENIVTPHEAVPATYGVRDVTDAT
jgi:hypothetical protein